MNSFPEDHEPRLKTAQSRELQQNLQDMLDLPEDWVAQEFETALAEFVAYHAPDMYAQAMIDNYKRMVRKHLETLS